MRVPPQNPIYNNPMLPIAAAQNVHNVDDFAVWDKNKVIKLVTGVGLSIIFLYVLERFGNVNHIVPPVIPVDSFINNQPNLLPPTPLETIKPCVPTITAYRVILDGNCNNEEIDAAYAKRSQLFDDRQTELKEEGRRNADEFSKKIQISIDKLTEERDNWVRDFDERQRKINNPTPEEKAAQDREIDCLLDQKFLGWPGYEPKCLKHDFDILGATIEDNCSKLGSKFRKLSVKYHPDKNNSTEAKQKFIDISNAYQKLCP